MQLVLAGNTYTKKSARERCSKILNAYQFGATISLLDHWFLLDVLQGHGNAENKIGCGVASFQVERHWQFGTPCFWITRVDGTRTYFGYKWCFEKSPSDETRARMGFRSEVVDQIVEFKTATFAGRDRIPCAITGIVIPWDEANVDHEPPFHVLRDSFLQQVGLSLGQVRIQPWREGESRYLFEDRQLASLWSNFHQQFARLQVISAEENAKKGGKANDV